MTFDRDLDPSKLSDRELLILLYQGMCSVTKELDDHEKRVRSLEVWGYRVAGAFTLALVLLKLAQ